MKRVHEDATALVELSLIDHNECGALLCPYADILMNMHVVKKAT